MNSTIKQRQKLFVDEQTFRILMATSQASKSGLLMKCFSIARGELLVTLECSPGSTIF